MQLDPLWSVAVGRTCNLATGQRQWQDHAPAMDTTTTRFLNGVITINYEPQGSPRRSHCSKVRWSVPEGGAQKHLHSCSTAAHNAASLSLLPTPSPQWHQWVRYWRQSFAYISNGASNTSCTLLWFSHYPLHNYGIVESVSQTADSKKICIWKSHNNWSPCFLQLCLNSFIFIPSFLTQLSTTVHT